MLIPMAQTLRLYAQMFLNYGLYVCIILETAHHRTTFGKNSQKTFPYFFTNCTFFLWEGQGHFWDKDQISTAEGRRKG